jgi:DNA-binding CsgD family transcriptional regulator
MSNTANSDIQAAETAEKADEALALRREKLSYRAIAERMGISHAYAYKLIQNAIRAIPAENAAEVRALELADLDDLERTYLPIALIGSAVVTDKNGVAALVIADTTKAAADIVLKCKAHRLKIVPSLAVPVETKTDMTVSAGEATPAQAAELMKAAFGKVTPSDLARVSEDAGESTDEPTDA